MSKRKATTEDKTPSKSKDEMDVDDEDSGDDDGDELLNVDFEYFDPSPEIDFHGLKTLLRQLFDADNQLFDLSELADLILSQPLLGTTIKCDGQESDPYAFLTVLNMREHRAKGVIEALRKWILSRSSDEVREALGKLLEGGEAQVGLVLTERYVNMPHQTVPPMYTMLLEEIAWANAEGEAYNFTHYLVISKTYIEVESTLETEDSGPKAKKSKKSAAGKRDEVYYFHPEDEVLQRHALVSGGFEYEKGEEGSSDSKRAFQELGVKPRGLLVLIEAGALEGAVREVGTFLGGEDAVD